MLGAPAEKKCVLSKAQGGRVKIQAQGFLDCFFVWHLFRMNLPRYVFWFQRKNPKYPQYCWEFHDQLWPLRNHFRKKKRPQPYWGGEIILEMLWEPQMPWIIGLWISQPYSRGEFQETLWERFRGLSGIFPEFLRESPSRTGGVAQKSRTKNEWKVRKPPRNVPEKC